MNAAVTGAEPIVDDGMALGARARSVTRTEMIPVVVALPALAVYGSVGALRYLTYHAPAYDLAFFEQVAEQTAAGHPFADSFNPYVFLGQHWEPILALPALLDRLLTPTALWLIALQSLALAAAPIMAWRLARAWRGGRGTATVAALVTALSPLIAGGAAFDYHSEALTPSLALAALDGAARGRTWRFVLPLLGLALIKEDALLVVAGVCWIVWCVEQRPLALWLGGGALTAAALLVGIVMPGLRGGAPGDLGSRYAYLGGDRLSQSAAGALIHPLRPLSQLVGGDARRGWLRAFGPLAFLPLLAGTELLAALPVLGVALLSAQENQASLQLQYGLEAFPLLLACALLGWRRLRGRRWYAPAGMVLLACTLVAYATTATLPGGAHFDGAATAGLERHDTVGRLLAMVPHDASVAATNGLVAHLANRPAVHEFPEGQPAEYVVIDSRTQPSRYAVSLGYWPAVTRLPAQGYWIVASADGVAVWHR